VLGMAHLWVVTDSRQAAQRMPAALVKTLAGRGIRPRVVIADRGVPSLRGLEPGDLVVGRTRHRAGLALLEAAELHGGRTFPPREAVRTVRNKAEATLSLARAGIRVPPTVVAYSPEQAVYVGFPMILKPVFGEGARGVRVVHGPLALEMAGWDGTPLLAQSYVETGGVDLTLYVAGEHVWAVRRPSPLLVPHAGARRVGLTLELRALAVDCADQFGLRLLSVDVLETPSGPVVVDVDEFPNYTGIDEAPEVIADVLQERLAHVSAGNGG
jgi:ribosomal protein S6--L-glutamate ligase